MAKFIHATGPIVKVSSADVAAWEIECLEDPDHKFRFCAHLTIDDPIHEMLITHTDKTVVPAHKHRGKSESFTWLTGVADVILWDESGNIRETIPMGPYGSYRRYCYYRLNADIYHSLNILAPVVTFLEVTPGPWKKEDLILASWWTPPPGWTR